MTGVAAKGVLTDIRVEQLPLDALRPDAREPEANRRRRAVPRRLRRADVGGAEMRAVRDGSSRRLAGETPAKAPPARVVIGGQAMSASATNVTVMRVEEVAIDELRPDPANPRGIGDAELEAPARSLRQFGFDAAGARAQGEDYR
jgi:hypothetical protein